MVVIRLRRAGSKKRPFFRVVATDSRFARDGRFIEILGHYNPRTKPAIVRVNQERVEYWIQRGAQPSGSVRTLIARHLTPVQQVPQAVPAAREEEAGVKPAQESPATAVDKVPPPAPAEEP